MRIMFHSIASFAIGEKQRIRWEGEMVVVVVLTKRRATDPTFWEYQARIIRSADES